MKKNNRPPCPQCKGRMVSNGTIRWRCTECGHSPTKVKIERIKPDYSKRPPCPHCGIYHALKNTATDYKCGNCHRSFNADWEANQVYQEEVRKIKADAVIN